MLDTPIGRLRVVAFVEGISFLLLLFVAMPLKYAAGMPEAVRVVGMVHGVLFLAFAAALAHAALAGRWKPARAGWAFASAVVPFGTFFLDAHLRREQARSGAGARLAATLAAVALLAACDGPVDARERYVLAERQYAATFQADGVEVVVQLPAYTGYWPVYRLRYAR